MTSIIKYSNLNEKISIKISDYCFFIKNNIITPYFTNFKDANIFIYQGNNKNFNYNNLLLNIFFECKNEIIFIKIDIILINYLKIIIFNNSNIFYFNIIKINKDIYLKSLRKDQKNLLSYCNKIKEHIFSKHFIMSNKNSLIDKLNQVIYTISNYNLQKILDINLKLNKKFIL